MSEFKTIAELHILEVLLDQAPLHVIEIADVVDQHPVTVDRICSRLNEQGHIYQLNRGIYEITEDGKRQINDRCDSSA